MTRFFPYFVFAFFVLCYAIDPASTLYTHYLNDPDDYMRLDEVVRWLGGQNWYDLSVPRMSPGAETIVHWSRLIDLPIAAVAIPFISTFGITQAAMIASSIVPFFWFALFLTVMYFLAAPLVGHKRAAYAGTLVFFAPQLLFNYTPGRVDHHGVQAIIAAFGLLSFGRIIMDDKGTLFAILSAALFACGFWIGAEALPWVILFIICLTIIAAIEGGRIARHAAVFGIFLPLFTATLIPIALPTTEFSSRALSWFSPTYAIFAALAGGVLIIGWALGRLTANKSLRLALYASCGVAAAAAFIALIPSVLKGIFADYDMFDATTALDNIGEAMPLTTLMHVNRFMPASFVSAGLIFARILCLPLIALGACLFAIRKTRGTHRLVWVCHGIFLATATALAIFWQNRVGIFMDIFMLVPLTWLMGIWWDHLKERPSNKPLFWIKIIAFLLLLPLPIYLLPMAVHKLYPPQSSSTTCGANLDNVTKILNDTKGLGAQTHTIMNISEIGPELLLQTRHNVVSGNFDVPGNEDAFTFFSAFDDTQARGAAHKWNADLVLICSDAPTMYLDKDYYKIGHAVLKADSTGMLRFVNIDPQQPLIERLIRGEAPNWLKKIEIPGGSDYLLFAIKDTGND